MDGSQLGLTGEHVIKHVVLETRLVQEAALILLLLTTVLIVLD